jgi:hypothetical protein
MAISISGINNEIRPFLQYEFHEEAASVKQLCENTCSSSYPTRNAAMAALHELKAKIVPIIIRQGIVNCDDSQIIRRIDVRANDLWNEESDEQEALGAQEKEFINLEQALYASTGDEAADAVTQQNAAARIWEIIAGDTSPTKTPLSNTAPSLHETVPPLPEATSPPAKIDSTTKPHLFKRIFHSFTTAITQFVRDVYKKISRLKHSLLCIRVR